VAFVAVRLWRSRRTGVSIRMQIFLALAGIVGAFALGLGLLVLDRVRARTTALAEESARSEALTVGALIANDLSGTDRSLANVARRVTQASRDVRLTLLDEHGRTIFAAEGREDEEIVSVTEPILVDGVVRGFVRVDKPTIAIRRALEDFAPTILGLSVTLGLAAAIAAALIGKTIATPIEELTEFAVKLSEGKLLATAPRARGREVKELSRAIETMRRELEGRPFVETFAADLSHELKNPVAAIKASAEVLSDGALDEPALARGFVDRISEATARIEVLLGELLSLARIEARGVSAAEPVDLRQVIDGEVPPEGRELVVDGPAEPALVRGDALWLSRLVHNLIDNAVKHSAAGTIRVSLASSGTTLSLSVENDGAVAEHVRAKLFRRFVTTRADRGGTGLGLAIARAVAEAHGGSIRCASAGPPVVRFEVLFPAVPRGPISLLLPE
jgi:signal transduction histidine kinase